MPSQRMQLIGLSVVFGILSIIVLLIWLPYLKLVAIGAILAILFLPVYKNVLKRKPSESFAAAITLVCILLVVMIPLYLIGQAVYLELNGAYENFRSGGIVINKAQIIDGLPESARGAAENFLSDLNQKISDVAGAAFQGVQSVIFNIASFILAFFLTMFTTYYLLKDGRKVRGYINSILPLSEAHEDLLVSKLEDAVNEVVKGSFMVALLQGVVATIGFLIFGVPNAFLWGSFTVMAALVPTVGTSIALVPAIVYLFITGHTGAGIGLAIWGALAVGMIDNIVGPKLVGARTHLHPLMVLFSVLGGIQLFGFVGFLLGPILMAVFVTLLDIYRTDMMEYFKQNETT